MQDSQQTDTREDEGEISLLDLLQMVVEHRRLLVVGPLLIGALALGIAFALPPIFTANTKFLPPQQQQSSAAGLLQSLGALGGLAGAATGIKSPADQYVAYLKSRAVQDPLLQEFDLVSRYKSKAKDDARKELTENSRITAGKDGLISIDVDDTDPTVAANLANAYVAQLGKLLSRLAVTEAQQRRLFFEKQLAQAKTGLTTAETALREVGITPDVLKAQPTAAVGALAQLQAQIAAQEVKVASMRGYLAESAPDFKQALTELAALRTQVGKADGGSNTASGAVTKTAKQGDYVARYRDFKYHETLFELFAKQYEIARVDEAREGAVIQVLDMAEPPERKSKPKRALIAMLAALATGLMLLLFVFSRQALRNAGNEPETAAKLDRLKAAFRRKV